MPTLATGISSKRDHPPRQRGFTLLEILAVIIIIAVTVSLASLSLGGRAQDQRLVNEADRLHQLMLLAAEEATVRGEELGLLVAADGYRFYHLEQHRWTAYKDGPFRERRVPENMRLYLHQESGAQLRVVDSPVPVAGNDERSDDSGKNSREEKTAPQILFLSSGELTPFVIELHDGAYPVYYRAEGRITGDIDMKRISSGPA